MVRTSVIVIGLMLSFAAPVGAIPLESWDDKIPSAGTRFKVLSEFNGEAVLDKETQLVWEQAPSTFTLSWHDARAQCLQLAKGGRKGWRLPSVTELMSLIDPSVPGPGPTLPPGHSFTNVQSTNYLTATTNADAPTAAWMVDFFTGGVVVFGFKNDSRNFWCVRGGMNADQY